MGPGEPVSGFEPPTVRLQEIRPPTRWALAAQIARIIAVTALTPLGLSDAPVHEPVHVARQAESHDRNPA
jgi:hypothetical protein